MGEISASAAAQSQGIDDVNQAVNKVDDMQRLSMKMQFFQQFAVCFS